MIAEIFLVSGGGWRRAAGCLVDFVFARRLRLLVDVIPHVQILKTNTTLG
jgi:hypothetical protein